jgi:hypothetical protein
MISCITKLIFLAYVRCRIFHEAKEFYRDSMTRPFVIQQRVAVKASFIASAVAVTEEGMENLL